ncbi:ABC transporter permease [Spirillospora sp. CA-142024]|uniref:ABC transporter permease n=1 Tax=Spirillospora sp. CA-142024 TaxID=3240036 RepID=UPI003D92718D
MPVNAFLAVAMAVLLAAAVAVCHFGRLGHTRAVLRAGLRAAVQLAVVSLIIGVVVTSVPLVAVFVVVMYAVAVRTSGRRLTEGRSWWWTAAPIAAGVAPVLTMLLVTGLLPPKGVSVIPVAGILIGGALTATYLSGRRALDELAQRHGEVEAALSLGMLDRDARLLIARDKAATALVPAIDQTRTVGLVTLPGAFVGMMLGGASPFAAGAVQLFVLIALLAIEAVATLLTLELVARGAITDQEPAASRTIRLRAMTARRSRAP